MDERVQVNFPSKMKVESPEINSIARTAERISNWLHYDFKQIIQPLQVLPSIPRILEDLKERLINQFRSHFSGQVAIQMKAREANIRVAERKARLIEDHLEKKKHQFEDSRKRVLGRYEKLSNRIAEEHSSFLKQLDGHVFEITDNIYPNQIQDKFSFISVPFWQELAKHTSESAIARSSCLFEGYNEANEVVEKFIDKRKECYQKASSLSTEKVEEGKHEIPFWFAVIEDSETGEKETKIFFNFDKNQDNISIDEKNIVELKREALRIISTEKMQSLDRNELNKIEYILRIHHSVPEEEIARFHNDCRNIYMV